MITAIAACGSSGNSDVSPSAQAPSTQAPSTQAPSTQAPSTQAPSTQAPSTQAPSTSGGISGASPAERVGGLGTIPNAPCREPSELPAVVVSGAADLSVARVGICLFGFDAREKHVTVQDASGVVWVDVWLGAKDSTLEWYPGLEAALGDAVVRADQPAQAGGGGQAKTATAKWRVALPAEPLLLSLEGREFDSGPPGATVTVHVFAPEGSSVLVVLGGPLGPEDEGPIVARKKVKLPSGRTAVTFTIPTTAAKKTSWCAAVAGEKVVARCSVSFFVP